MHSRLSKFGKRPRTYKIGAGFVCLVGFSSAHIPLHAQEHTSTQHEVRTQFQPHHPAQYPSQVATQHLTVDPAQSLSQVPTQHLTEDLAQNPSQVPLQTLAVDPTQDGTQSQNSSRLNSAAPEELSCDVEHQITAEFSNGAGWAMCWHSARRENLVLSEIHYQNSEQNLIRVISSLRLAQLNVNYDDSDVTYNDVTQFGLGGGYVSTLTDRDCPLGELVNINGRAGLCKQITQNGENHYTDLGITAKEVLSLTSISQVGSYAYLVTWTFHDDGSIAPSIGAAGALQRSTDHTNAQFGRELEGTPNKYWLSHTHNYYWRIDFDIGANELNDIVTELSYPLTMSSRRTRNAETFTEEVARKTDPSTLTSWLISEPGDSILSSTGYLIEPVNYGHKLARESIEPFTEYDFFVTRQNDCERFLNENAKFHPECGDDILDYVNDESLVDEDIVVWHRISFHHVPRNEDRLIMHSHWDGFLMQARNFSSDSPQDLTPNQEMPPSLNTIVDQISDHNSEIKLQLVSEPTENRTGDINTRFSAAGLPSGLTLSENGFVSGTATTPGVFRVTVRASKNHFETSSTFNWIVIKEPGLGHIQWHDLLILLAFFCGMFSLQRRLNA